MTYKHYIMTNRIKDSKDAYKNYLESESNIFRAMSDTMKAQHVNVTYKFRFAIQF